MTSNIFNLIGHYKNWAIKNNIHPTVFLIYTTATKTFKNSIGYDDNNYWSSTEYDENK